MANVTPVYGSMMTWGDNVALSVAVMSLSLSVLIGFVLPLPHSLAFEDSEAALDDEPGSSSRLPVQGEVAFAGDCPCTACSRGTEMGGR